MELLQVIKELISKESWQGNCKEGLGLFNLSQTLKQRYCGNGNNQHNNSSSQCIQSTCFRSGSVKHPHEFYNLIFISHMKVMRLSEVKWSAHHRSGNKWFHCGSNSAPGKSLRRKIRHSGSISSSFLAAICIIQKTLMHFIFLIGKIRNSVFPNLQSPHSWGGKGARNGLQAHCKQSVQYCRLNKWYVLLISMLLF